MSLTRELCLDGVFMRIPIPSPPPLEWHRAYVERPGWTEPRRQVYKLVDVTNTAAMYQLHHEEPLHPPIPLEDKP